MRATRVDSHSRGLSSNVGARPHSGSGWQLIRQHVRLAHSDARNGRRSVATCGVAFSGASHRPHSSGAALPGVSLADRSPRRVPGHYAPPRSRALLSSNHGVSRRQAGAATYGRFSVRPLGPLGVWPRGALGLWLDYDLQSPVEADRTTCRDPAGPGPQTSPRGPGSRTAGLPGTNGVESPGDQARAWSQCREVLFQKAFLKAR